MPLSSYLDNPEVAETIGIAWQYTPDHISKYFSIDDQESQHTFTKTTQSFTYFPELPLEFRNKIWKLACFKTRNVCVSAKEWDTHCYDSDEEYDRDEAAAEYASRLKQYFFVVVCPHSPILLPVTNRALKVSDTTSWTLERRQNSLVLP
jgi:2EXR family